MPKRPRAPGAALLAWLTITGHAIAIAASLGAPLLVILGLTATDVLGVAAILSFYFGRSHEWQLLERHFTERERRRNSAPAEPRASFGGAKREAA